MSLYGITNYTLERDVRELQLTTKANNKPDDYTLERDVRELQHPVDSIDNTINYTLERDVRELQLEHLEYGIHLIIPLREMLGNYNNSTAMMYDILIIPLREMLGNYNAW